MQRCEDVIDRAARYAQLGRRYQHLLKDELGVRWIAAFRATVRWPHDHSARLLQEDLFAEHQLRRIDPPYGAVSREREQLVAEVLASLREMKYLRLIRELSAPAGPSGSRPRQ